MKKIVSISWFVEPSRKSNKSLYSSVHCRKTSIRFALNYPFNMHTLNIKFRNNWISSVFIKINCYVTFLETNSRKVPGSIAGRACRPSRSKFSVVFLRNSHKYGIWSLRKAPLPRALPIQAYVPHTDSWP